VSILAALGMNMLGTRLWPSARPLYVVLPLLLLFALGLAKVAAQLRGTFYAPTWGIVEELAPTSIAFAKCHGNPRDQKKL